MQVEGIGHREGFIGDPKADFSEPMQFVDQGETFHGRHSGRQYRSGNAAQVSLCLCLPNDSRSIAVPVAEALALKLLKWRYKQEAEPGISLSLL